MAYEKQLFEDDKTVLSAEHLEHIEDGIVDIENKLKNSKIDAILSDDGMLTFEIV